MYGWMFITLQKYSETKLGSDAWRNLLIRCGVTEESYKSTRNYPDEQMVRILEEISKVVGHSLPFVAEDFGRFIGIHLVDMYWYLIDPQWKTLDLLENIEGCYNKLHHHQVNFPKITCTRTSATKISLTYNSPRKMCFLAKGIIQGISRYYQEPLQIHETSCMLEGHSHCQMQLTTDSLSGAKVNIRMEQTHFDQASLKNTWKRIEKMSSPVTAIDRKIAPTSETWKEHTAIPGYDIIEKIGEGGMGVVYKAKQRSLERLVAIKLIAPELNHDEIFVHRLEKEAKAMALLQHPNIVSAIDFGFYNNCYYIVMEYLECCSLQSIIKEKNSIPEPQVIDIGIAIANALTCLSNHQLIHRDINPSNILIEKNHNPKLADLGLVKDLQLDTQVTIADTWLGTPMYMSAEQIQSEVDIDIRSDIYSLGSTLFHAVFGKTRFKSTKSIAAVYHQMLSEPPILKEDLKKISDGLGCILCKCLQQNPDNRYQSPAEMERDLRLLKKGKDILRTIHSKTKKVKGVENTEKDSSRVHCVSGNDYFSKGNLEEAMRCYDRAIKVDDKFAGAYCNRGKIHMIQDNFDNAVADYNEAIHCNPRLAKAYKNRGVIFYQTENFHAALADFHTYLELRPKALDYNKIRNYIKHCEVKIAEEENYE